MDKIKHQKFVVTADGTTGTGVTARPVNGRLVAVHLAYSASMAATADVTLEMVADGAVPQGTLLQVNNNATSGWYYPRATVVDSANTAITNGFDAFPVAGYVSASLAQGTDGETVTVSVFYEVG